MMIYFTENETKLYLEVRRLSLQAVLVSPWKKKINTLVVVQFPSIQELGKPQFYHRYGLSTLQYKHMQAAAKSQNGNFSQDIEYNTFFTRYTRIPYILKQEFQHLFPILFIWMSVQQKITFITSWKEIIPAKCSLTCPHWARYTCFFGTNVPNKPSKPSIYFQLKNNQKVYKQLSERVIFSNLHLDGNETPE